MIRRFLPLCPLFLLFLAVPARAQTFQFLDDEAEPGGYDVSAQITQAPAEFLLARAENGDAYDLKIAPNLVQLYLVGAKKPPRLLARASGKWKLPASFVAQRRGARWRFILNGQTALEAEDDSFNEGQIGTRGGVKDARVQPVEPIRFDDDFMRVASEVALKDALANPRSGVNVARGTQIPESIWSVAAGRFTTTGLTENSEALVAQSANPFAFRPLDAGANIALAGRPFWNDYSAQVSIQPQTAGEIGLLVYAQDAKNYLGMFWGDKSGPELRAVVAGKTQILDRAAAFGPFETHQWNRWRLDVAGGQLRGFIDDTEVLRARTGRFGRGQVGISAKLLRAAGDKKDEGALFDDASVRSVGDFYDDFSQIVPGRWKTVAGGWNLLGGAKAQGARGAYAVMGEPNWTGYRTSATLHVPRGASAGLLLNHISGQGAYWLRLQNPARGAGSAQIALIKGGKTTVLGQKSLGMRLGADARWTFEAQGGYLSAKIGDELIVDAFDTTLGAGRAGITAQNGQSAAQVSEFSVEWPQKTSNWAKVPEIFEVDMQAQTMGGWSTPQGFWVARPSGDKGAPRTNAVWHKGEFFGDEDVQFALPDLSGDKQMQLMFAGKAGEKLTLALAGKEELKATLSDGKRTWTGAAKLAAGAKLEIARRGTFFIVRSGDVVILAARV